MGNMVYLLYSVDGVMVVDASEPVLQHVFAPSSPECSMMDAPWGPECRTCSPRLESENSMDNWMTKKAAVWLSEVFGINSGCSWIFWLIEMKVNSGIYIYMCVYIYIIYIYIFKNVTSNIASCHSVTWRLLTCHLQDDTIFCDMDILGA